MKNRFIYIMLVSLYVMRILFFNDLMSLSLPKTQSLNPEAIFNVQSDIITFLFASRLLNSNTTIPKPNLYLIAFAISIFTIKTIYFFSGNLFLYFIANTATLISFFIIWIVSLTHISKIKITPLWISGYIIGLNFVFLFLLPYDFDIIPNDIKVVLIKVINILEVFIFLYFLLYHLDTLSKENQKLTKELDSSLKENKECLEPHSFYFLLEENSLTKKALTIQEVKVLKCIHQGMSNSEIADKLFVSYNTIKFHIRNIYQKLEVKNRKEIKQKLLKFQDG